MANQTINDLAQAVTPLDQEGFVEIDVLESGVRVSRKASIRNVTAPVTATSAELDDISNAINTSASKTAGYEVFNTTTGRPVWATGATAGSVWNFADGTVAHTPV